MFIYLALIASDVDPAYSDDKDNPIITTSDGNTFLIRFTDTAVLSLSIILSISLSLSLSFFLLFFNTLTRDLEINTDEQNWFAPFISVGPSEAYSSLA